MRAWRIVVMGCFITLALTVGGWTTTGAPQLLTVRVSGFAEGIGVTARDNAIFHAQQEAVRNYLTSITHSEDIYPLRPILRNAQRYVAAYDLLRHDIRETETRVELDVQLFEKALRQDFATIMLPRMPRTPKVLLVIGEKIGKDTIVGVTDFGVSETVLKEGLERLRLEVAGVDSIDAYYSLEELMDVVLGDVEVGRRFALGQLADVVVLGAALTETEGEAVEGLVQRHRAKVELRLFRVKDGKMTDALTAVASVHSADRTSGTEQAVQDACKKLLGDTTVSAVLSVVGTEPMRDVLLTIPEPGSPKRLEQLTAVLQSIPGVYAVQRVVDIKKLARFRVNFEGSMMTLADTLCNAAYEGARLEIKRAVDRSLEACFIAQ